MSAHAPVTTLAEWDALDGAEVVAGYIGAEKGDPEPGANHSRSYHHGWRTRMMDMGEIPRPPEHDRLVRGRWIETELPEANRRSGRRK
jgi:hypothetical protein